MQDHATRLVGLDGLVVTGVQRTGEQLDLQVELLSRAGGCPRCGGSELRVKERPRVRVRDLPIAGTLTRLVWRKRRYCCWECGRTFSETHEQLPARQRVTARFRERLAERVVDGAAHAEVAREERTTRYQVARAFADLAGGLEARDDDHRPRRLSLDEAHHRRGHELATVVSDLDRRCVIEVLDGRDRRTVERWLGALPAEVRAGVEVVSIDPYDAYRQAIHAALPHARIVCDHFHLVRGANTALDAVRRERQRHAKARRPKGVRRSGQHAAWRPELYHARHRLLKARERLTGRERRRLSELFERDPLIAEAWGLKERFRDVYRASDRTEAERRLELFLAAVDRAGLPAFDAFAKGIHIWQQELLAYFDEPTTKRLRRRHHQQGQGHQTPRLRHPHLHRLPPARAPSMRLTGITRRHPAQSTRTHFSTGAAGSVFRRRPHPQPWRLPPTGGGPPKTQRPESSPRIDPSTITSPATRPSTQISRGARGTIATTPPRNHSPTDLTKAPVQTSGSRGVEDVLDVAVGIDDDGRLIPAASIGQRH
jgi:transposase